MRREENVPLPDEPPSDWQLIRAWLGRTYARHRSPILIGSNLLTILVMILVFNALRPAPQHLTQRDIDGAVARSLQNAPPAPSNASVAYDAIRPSLVVVAAKLQEGGKARSTLGAGSRHLGNGGRS